MDWSQRAREVVHATLASLPAGATIEEKRAALRAAYPFGPREYWPYKAWCKAARQALGLPTKNVKRQKKKPIVHPGIIGIAKQDAGEAKQTELFGGEHGE